MNATRHLSLGCAGRHAIRRVRPRSHLGTEAEGSEIISLATGYRQPLARAPAIATVIPPTTFKTGGTTLAEVSPPYRLHVSTARGLTILCHRGFSTIQHLPVVILNGFR